MSRSIQVLDHGYVRLIEHWGSDERIIEAARMSTDGAFRGWGPRGHVCPGCGEERRPFSLPPPQECRACGFRGDMAHVHGDEKLLRYLYAHDHTSPFEMAGLVIEAQLPIFVCRQWHRHRTWSYNELSARYTEMPNLCYVPSIERLTYGGQATTNKQSSGEPLTPEDADCAESWVTAENVRARETYEDLLQLGVSRELARVILPVSAYTRMRASANLHNVLSFLRKRLADDAQWELRQYADTIGKIVSDLFPRTWGLFTENRAR